MGRVIVVGTRSSPLALRQTEEVVDRLRSVSPGYQFEIEQISTRGDEVLDRPLPTFGDRGIFVKEMEVALRERRVDVAVHSLKDVPTQLPEGLTIGAVTGRSDPSDALVLAERHRHQGRTVSDLPRGARIGTGSLRREAQLRAFRSDLQVESVRGNLQTRLRKLEEEGFDALILATAGLERLGLEQLIAQRLPLSTFLPAPGQGALALEMRADDDEVQAVCGRIEDRAVRAEITAERAVLATLGGGCWVPIGAWGQVQGKELRLDAMVSARDGQRVVRTAVNGSVEEAERLGRDLAHELLAQGAKAILEELQ